MELKKSGEIKSFARSRLSGCWAECVSIFLINLGISVIFILSVLLTVKFCYSVGVLDFDIDHIVSQGTLTFYVVLIMVMLVSEVLASPLSYGADWFYMQAILGRKAPVSSFFSCYTSKKLALRVMKLHLMVAMRKLAMVVPLALLIIGELLVAERILSNTGDDFIYSVILCCFVLVTAGMMLAYILVSMRYKLVKHIYALDPEKPAELIIKESVRCVVGNESYILEIFLSIGIWIVSCIFIFPAFYAVPYIKMVMSSTAKELIEYGGDIKIEKKRSGTIKEENTFV